MRLKGEIETAKSKSSTHLGENALTEAGLETTAIILGKIQQNQNEDLSIVVLGDILTKFFEENTFIQLDSVPELATRASVTEIEFSALLMALHRDGFLQVDSDGDYMDGGDFRRLTRTIPLIHVLNR